MGLFEEGLDRGGMNRAVNRGRGGAITGKFIEKEAGNPLGMRRIAKSLFLNEGVGLQPIQQLCPVRGDNLCLRVMHMGVDKTRHDQLAGIVIDRCSIGQVSHQVGGLANLCDEAIRAN